MTDSRIFTSSAYFAYQKKSKKTDIIVFFYFNVKKRIKSITDFIPLKLFNYRADKADDFIKQIPKETWNALPQSAKVRIGNKVLDLWNDLILIYINDK